MAYCDSAKGATFFHTITRQKHRDSAMQYVDEMMALLNETDISQ
jgi:hypothetical protein